MAQHPIQPTEFDNQGVRRFKSALRILEETKLTLEKHR
jgi:hypothetical protein